MNSPSGVCTVDGAARRRASVTRRPHLSRISIFGNGRLPDAYGALNCSGYVPSVTWFYLVFRVTANRKLIAYLKDKGLTVTAVETPGAHHFNVWRDNLVQFAPLLFR